MEVRVALIGQPNVGKSSLFKALTGGDVRIANWPGTTVERVEGVVKYKGREIRLIDLPGIYGFSAITLEEKLSREYILSGEPHAVVVLVDATLPERTLYLAVEALELTGNVIVAFTKTDLTHSYGIHINYDLIQSRLKAPVVTTSIVDDRGLRTLLEKILETVSKPQGEPSLKLSYGELEPFVDSVQRIIMEHRVLPKYPSRWLAVKLLEGDADLEEKLLREAGEEVLNKIRAVRSEAQRIICRDLAAFTASKRFQFILEVLGAGIVKKKVASTGFKYRFFYNPVIGPVASILILTLMFLVAFTINTGFPLNTLLSILGQEELAEAVEKYSVSGLMEEYLGAVQEWVADAVGNPVAASLIAEGVVGGVGTVLTFIPLILVVSLILSMLEDSGVLPRMAIGAHYLTSKIGLSGASIFPLTLSLGCNVPAILATRASISLRERLRLTITLPFIPCQARLIVLLALSTALSTFSSSLLVITGYLAAFLAFITVNYALYRLQDKPRGRSPELLLEVPPVHKPVARVLWWMVWSDLKHFVKRAGLVILSASVAVWFLTHVSTSLELTLDPSESIAAEASRVLTPLLEPIGVSGPGAWIVLFSLLIGFFAKELFISTLLVVSGSSTVRQAASLIGLTDAELIPLAVFTVLYVPCVATLSAIYSETRSAKHVVLTLALMMAVAYAGALITRLLITMW
jgi:ferrous iron transport protein B